MFAVLQRHLWHEIAVIATGQRLRPVTHDHFGGFEPHEGIAVEDDGHVLIADLLRVQVSAERILRRLALRLVLVQLEILLMILTADVLLLLLILGLCLDQLQRFLGVDALLQAEFNQR